MYAEFVFDQKIATWLLCHQHAFEFFKAVPHRIVLDNLKSAIIRAYTQDDDPAVQQSYRECAEHYGFLIDPCPAEYVDSAYSPSLSLNASQIAARGKWWNVCARVSGV